MEENTTEDSSPVVSALNSARFVFGALVNDDVSLVECVDEEAFSTQADADMALATAVASIGSELIPIVVEVEEPPELAEIQRDTGRITDIDALTEAVETAPAYYLLVNTTDGSWKRIRHAVDNQFTTDSEVTDPEDNRYRVASPLVDEARERIADLPDSVDRESIQTLSWS